MDAVIGELRDTLQRIVYCEEPTLAVLVTYTGLCHLATQGAFHTVPYSHILGPAGSGKTVTGRTLAILTNGCVTGGRSPASVFRWLDRNWGHLLVFDEGESVLRGARRAEFEEILLNGDSIGAPITRVAPGQGTVQLFDIFGPKMLISIRGIDPSAFQRRIIPIRLDPSPMTFTSQWDDPAWNPVAELGDGSPERPGPRSRLKQWALTAIDAVKARLADYAKGLDFVSPAHRALWAPMLAVADVVGIDLKETCAAHGATLEQLANLTLRDALEELLPRLPPGKYYVGDLRQRLLDLHGQRAALWSAERVGRALHNGYRFPHGRDRRGRYVEIAGGFRGLLRRAGLWI